MNANHATTPHCPSLSCRSKLLQLHCRASSSSLTLSGGLQPFCTLARWPCPQHTSQCVACVSALCVCTAPQEPSEQRQCVAHIKVLTHCCCVCTAPQEPAEQQQCVAQRGPLLALPGQPQRLNRHLGLPVTPGYRRTYCCCCCCATTTSSSSSARQWACPCSGQQRGPAAAAAGRGAGGWQWRGGCAWGLQVCCAVPLGSNFTQAGQQQPAPLQVCGGGRGDICCGCCGQEAVDCALRLLQAAYVNAPLR